MVGRQHRRRRATALPLFGSYEELSSESLPEGWILINEVNEDGVLEADLPLGPILRCTRCRNAGHQAPQCGFSESYVRAINALYQPPAYRRGQAHRTMYQCSRCGRYGHNSRTCHGPLVPMMEF